MDVPKPLVVIGEILTTILIFPFVAPVCLYYDWKCLGMHPVKRWFRP